MVKVKVRRDDWGVITGFSITGHARYAGHGSDIVCAGVSAVAQTAVLGLRQVAGIPVQVDEGPGKLECLVGDHQPEPGENAEAIRQKAQAILEAMVIGLRDIEKDYPKHVRVSEA